jgi:FKBP-type peptidyl-prolyl cis-trans isomerase
MQVSLPDEDAKAFHALGYNIGNQLGDIRGFEATEVDYVLSGIKAALMDEPPEVPLAEYVPKAAAKIQAKQAKLAEKVAEDGRMALATAAKEEGATQTASGLVVKTLVDGDGPSPTAADTVEVHYEGKLTDGSIFDSSYKRGEPISFPLSGVIKGWTEGLQLMKVGGKALLTIPYDIAYGERGSPPTIPPMATLVFTVELLAIK